MRALRVAAAKCAGRLPPGAALSFALQCAPRGWRQDPLAVAAGMAVQAFVNAVWSGQATASAIQACIQESQQ
eukprot:231546-Pyramimonas_sp.AAC.1